MFTLNSKDIKHGEMADSSLVYDKAGCQGRNRSPQMSWTNAPAGTLGFAITLHDPDAPRPGGWWHWLMLDVPATTTMLPTGAGAVSGMHLPKGAMHVVNDYGEPGYGGPCPPIGHGVHRYVLTVHALSVEHLGVKADAALAEVEKAILAVRMASAELVFRYGR